MSSGSSESKVQVSPKKTPSKVHEQEKEKDHENKEKKPKEESEKSLEKRKNLTKIVEKVEKIEKIEEYFEDEGKKTKDHDQVVESVKAAKSPEKFVKVSPEKSVKVSPEKPVKVSPEKIKIDLKLERKKSPKRIEKPKVNIFLEDSDEVDEFEASMMEVRSKWSSPERTPEEVKPPPRMVSPPVLETISNIPMVVESPEKSPVLSIFEISKSVTMQKSPTPSPPLKPTKVRNVCSFLSDIASGNMFAGLGLGSGLYDEANSIDGLNLNDYKRDNAEASKAETKSKVEIEAMEPDTTVLKSNIIGSITPSDDSDSDESESESSSSSDSDDTTSESDESSDDSSDDDIPTFTRGFGRFDASSMPMVTQIKPVVAPVGTPSTPVSRFQPQQSVIKPPELITNITKPAFYTPSTVHQVSATPTPFTVGLGSLSFPIPFKIYSLRDATNCEFQFPSLAQPAVQTVAIPTPTDKDKRDSEKDKKDRDRKRSRSRSRSHERDKKRVKDDRRKTPPRSRGRQTDERKDSRRKDPSPRHNSHSSRTLHVSR